MTFLSARWTHLVLANYAVDPALLRPHLPRGTEPDLLGVQRIAVEADPSPRMPPPGGEADWFKEHRRGFGTDHFGRTIRYEVDHPRWAVHEVRSLFLQWDWVRVYGRAWGALQDARPHSVLLAAGSRVKVRPMGAA